ncbi:MAG: deaminase domain-containing protein [Pandoraea sp.]|nr:deaminase domain-containing protein [Pandoraea sp.]MDR3397521.1 deaminase domain-containing protein [Pandoraea sp.]
MGLLAVACAAGVASAAIIPGAPVTGLRSISRRNALAQVPATVASSTLSHSEALAGIHGLLRVWPTRPDGDGVMAQCLPAPRTRSVGASSVPAGSTEALRAGLTAYRGDIQRAVVTLIRESVAAADAPTRAAFANAEVLIPSRKTLIVEREGAPGSRETRVAYEASHAISLHLRNDEGIWREFALSLAFEAPALITPVVSCGPRNRFGQRCFAQTYGPVFWGERWPSIESRIGENDEIRFTLKTAGATISPGWPSPESSVIDSPDMEEVAELLLDTLTSRSPRDRREAPDGPDVSSGLRPRRDALADVGSPRALASRLSMSGLECLAAVVNADKLHHDAIALLQHLWPDAAVQPPHEASDEVVLQAPPPTLPRVIRHEPFSGPLGRGVAWSLPPDVYVEYLPDRAQNGVKVFEINGELYGASVAHTRKHASDLRLLKDMRAELGAESLCRISRGVGTDVDGVCLECHGDREGEVAVTEQGATVTQHQAMEASPIVRLRVIVYSHPFHTTDGRTAFFAFGRLGHFDDEGVPRVSADSPVVEPSVYPPELNGELTFYEQPTTDGPVGGRRVRLTLGDMRIAAPFGTYRDGGNTLRGVVQLSHDVYYRFTLPVGDTGRSPHQVHLRYRRADHHDIREYRTAQNHRAAAENAIVLPTISYGEARTLLQLYLKVWEHAPTPTDVWRGLDDISLSVVEARQAIRALTRAIEHRVSEFRAQPVAEGASGFSSPPEVDAALMPMFNHLWRHWQHYPAQAEAFINAISRDFVSRPAPLAVWSQLPFVGDVQTTRDVLSIFETLFPDLQNLQGHVTGQARAAREVGELMRAVSGGANIAVAEVTLVDGTRTIYYCRSGLQSKTLKTNRTTVRIVDAGKEYARRKQNVIAQRRKAAPDGGGRTFTEPPALRFAMADADLPTYNAATRGPQSRTLDTERLILAQIYADHPLGTGVIRSIVLCSRLPFCDSCAVNLAMVPYHYPDAALRFYYVAPSARDRLPEPSAMPATPMPTEAAGSGAGGRHAPTRP